MQHRSIKDLMVQPGETIRNALRHISRGGLQIALVVDAGGRLIGTFTDGDWRRGLERDIELQDPVSAVMNAQPVVLRAGQDDAAALALMRKLGVRQLPIVDAGGQLLDVVTMDDLLKPGRQRSWVVLMAGGLGTRLRPLTHAVPKPMIPFGDRPLLEIMIEHLATQGFGRFFLAVNYKREVMETHFGDGARMGVGIEYVLESEQLGTAGALGLLPEPPVNPVLVLNGDILTTLDGDRLLRFHTTSKAPATLCVRDHAWRVPYGVVRLDDAGRYTAIDEKPLRTELVSAGINVLSPEAIALIPRGQAVDMPTLMDHVRQKIGPPAVYRMSEYWLDIGRVDDLRRAQADVNDHF